MKYRVVPGFLWVNPDFKNLAPSHKLLLLHLISGPHANVSGLFYLPLNYIAHETGLSLATIRQGIGVLKGKEFLLWDEPTETIWVVGMLSYQGGGEKILRAIADQVESLTPSQVIDAFRTHNASMGIPYRYPIDRASYKEKAEVKDEKLAEGGSPPSPAPIAEEEIPFTEIIAYLNETTGKNFRPTAELSRRHIRARWGEGYRLVDFQKVIDLKVAEWLGTEYAKYLRPQTLFGPNFESYLNSAPLTHSPTGDAYQPFKEEDHDDEPQ